MKPSLITRYCLAAMPTLAGASVAASTGKIDVHAHFVPEFYAQALRDAGHTPGPDGMPAIPSWTPETQLEFMKNNSIEKAYLSISSPGVYLTVPSKDATANATKLARQVNEYASALKGQYPDSFGFFASLPLPDIQSSLEEIEYCFTKLDPKPDGVVLMTNAYGMYFGDPELEPVHSALNALGVTIFAHPTTPCTEFNHLKFHTNASAPIITQKEWAALNRPISTRQFAAPILDFPFDSTRTFADLVYAKVPARFPQLTWIIAHAGGGLIPTIDRITNFGSLYNASITESSMRETLAKSFFFDLAGPWPVTYAIPSLRRWVDYTRIVWGSDTPFTPWATAGTGATSFDAGLQELFGNSSEADAIRRNNAKNLLG